MNLHSPVNPATGKPFEQIVAFLAVSTNAGIIRNNVDKFSIINR